MGTTSITTIFRFLLLLLCSQTPAIPAVDIPTLPSSPTELPPSSAISAAPVYLPDTPKFPAEPPVLTPDIMPVFPSPKWGADSGAAGRQLPTITSSPSPPNPDIILPDSTSTGPSSAAIPGGAPSLGSLVGFVSVGRALSLGLMITGWWLS